MIIYVNLYDFIVKNSSRISEIKTQYIELLSELTTCQDISTELFMSNLQKINISGQIIVGLNVPNLNGQEQLNFPDISNITSSFEIIGSGTIFIEPKIIHNAKSVGHIEDIVVKSSWRGKKISSSILDKLKKIGQENNCYKIILDCNENVSGVYKSNGFDVKGIQMSLYLD